MSDKQPPLNTLSDAASLIAKKSAAVDDSAITEYIRKQCEEVISRGEKLSDYYLVRQSGNMTYDGGNTIKSGVYYGLKHKDDVQIVAYEDEDR